MKNDLKGQYIMTIGIKKEMNYLSLYTWVTRRITIFVLELL